MKPLRVLAATPSLILAALCLAACANTPPRPPAPISTGEPRVDPQPQRTGPDTGAHGGVETGDLGDLSNMAEAETRGLTPPHMTGRDITRAAVLLPFSHPNRRVRSEAQGMLAGIEMALFEKAGDGFLIMPKDTGGSAERAATLAEEAISERADVILGPLFSANVQAVRSRARESAVPVIAFSNDPEAAGSGAWLASIAVEEEVARLVDYAARQGVDTFAFLGPRSDYGQRVERALRLEVVGNAGTVIVSRFYDPSNDAPVDAAEAVANVLKDEVEDRPGRVAILIPEEGVKLRSVAPLIPYYGVDFRKLRMLGTSRWNDPDLWREPTLSGGWFAAPAPGNLEPFEKAYRRNYGREPSELASLGYDAAAAAILLGQAGELDRDGITRGDGFMGLNGLFRFRPGGTAERSLSIMEIDRDEGAVVVEPGRQSFDPPVG